MPSLCQCTYFGLQVDVAVVEVGIGGTHDSTNIIE